MSVARRLENLERQQLPRPVEHPSLEARTVFAMSEEERTQVQEMHYRLIKLGIVGHPLDDDEQGQLVVTVAGTIVAAAGEWEALRRFPPETFPEFLFRRDPQIVAVTTAPPLRH